MRKQGLILTGLLLLCLCGCSARTERAVTTIEQLNDKSYTIGVDEGSAGMFAVEQYLPEAEIRFFSNHVTGFAAVQQGELDAYAYDRIMIDFAIAGGVDGVRLLDGRLGEPMDIAVGVSPKTTIPDLTRKINEFLAERRTDGPLDEMYNRIFRQRKIQSII